MELNWSVIATRVLKVMAGSVAFFLLNGCSTFFINAVETKLTYEEHFVTVNEIGYESGESESFGLSLTKKAKSTGNESFFSHFDFYPDLTFEQSKLHPRDESQRPLYSRLHIRRLTTFGSLRGIFYTFLGSFDISAGLGASYMEIFNENIDTCRLCDLKGLIPAFFWRTSTQQ